MDRKVWKERNKKLIEAVKGDNLLSARRLLLEGASPDAVHSEDTKYVGVRKEWAVLELAHSIEMERLLLLAGANPNGYERSKGRNPLQSLTHYNGSKETDRAIEAVRLLLLAGADPYAKRMDNRESPILNATISNKPQILRLLKLAAAKEEE